MNTSLKTAILLGGTGLTGGILLELLLRDPRYGKIVLFSRSGVGFSHPKLEEHLGDMLHLEEFRKVFRGDVVFCCIGTTRTRTPRKKVYREIDLGIPVTAAGLARENGIPSFIVVSAMGANPRSRLFYNRTKGKMEEGVLAKGVPGTYILRPSLIAGKRKERRPGEWIAKQLMKVFNLVLVGPLDRFRSIDPESIARAMLWLAANTYDNSRIPSDEIRRLAGKYRAA